MTPDQKKLLEELGRTQFGAALQAFLNSELSTIEDVNSAKSWDEVLGNQKASKLVRKLFSFMQDRPVLDKSKMPYV